MAAQELPKEFPCGSGSRRFPKNSPRMSWARPRSFPRDGSSRVFPRNSRGLDPCRIQRSHLIPSHIPKVGISRWIRLFQGGNSGLGSSVRSGKHPRNPWKNGIWRGSFGSSSFSMGIHEIPTPGRAKSLESSPILELGSFTSKDLGPHSQKNSFENPGISREYPRNPMPSGTNPAQILLCHSRFSFSLWNFSVGTAGNHQHS